MQTEWGDIRVSDAHAYRVSGNVVLPPSLTSSDKLMIRIALAPSSTPVPPEQPLNPRYAFKPLRRCDEFDLRVRFAPVAYPRQAWNLPGVPQGIVEDYAAEESLLRPDSDGYIHVVYRYLRVGLVYGVRWEY